MLQRPWSVVNEEVWIQSNDRIGKLVLENLKSGHVVNVQERMSESIAFLFIVWLLREVDKLYLRSREENAVSANSTLIQT
jgi:hypothetical protein